VSKVTLNDVRNTLTAMAQLMLKDGDTAAQDSAKQQAALVRAADAVVKAAGQALDDGVLYDGLSRHVLRQALAAFDKISNGEQT